MMHMWLILPQSPCRFLGFLGFLGFRWCAPAGLQVGSLHIKVANFTMLPDGAVEAAPARFKIPEASVDCVGPRNETRIIPRVGSAFTPPEEPANEAIVCERGVACLQGAMMLECTLVDGP
jgi:hypothetical protein